MSACTGTASDCPQYLATTGIESCLICGLRFSLYLLLLFLAVAGIAVFFASRPTVNISDLDLLEPDDGALARLNSRLDSIDELVGQSKRTGVAEPLQLVITELELNSKFSDWSAPGISVIAISQSRAAMRLDEIIFVGAISIAGQDFRYRVDVTIAIESAELRLEITHFQIGQLFAPEFLRSGLATVAALSVEAGVPRPPIDVETLIVSEGEMVISGSTRGL